MKQLLKRYAIIFILFGLIVLFSILSPHFFTQQNLTLIVTLGTMTVFQGLSYIISKQSVILNLPPAFKFFGQGYLFGFLPFSVVLMVFSVAIASFILNFTRFGRRIYGVGSNEETARLSGVNVNAVRMIVFSICGFFVALSSIVLFGRSGSASSSTGPGVEFTAMTSAILGGISFTGGEGKMWGLVIGAIFGLFKLPLPVPYGWGGVIGLIGMFIGGHIVEMVIHRV
jgi:XapX domain-containing protein